MRRARDFLGSLRDRLLPFPPVVTPDQLRRGGEAEIVAVADGDTVELEDGTTVRLVGIQAPKLPLGRPGYPTWPFAEEARAALSAMCLGRGVRLAYGGRRIDPHGRRLAHLFVDDAGEGGWVQGAMVRRGFARVYSFPDNRSCVRLLERVEGEARRLREGLWALDNYRVLDGGRPGEVRSRNSRYELVEGAPLSAERAGRRYYLNFGTNWRHDFTVTLPVAELRRFDWDGVSPKRLVGNKIRVRGWIGENGGPFIEVTHPEQIEIVLDDDRK
ncbi:MAG: thermonuclease family protein [Flavobacteriaceae bacterium]